MPARTPEEIGFANSALDELISALEGLPFKVYDLSPDMGLPFFEITHAVDVVSRPAIGFIAYDPKGGAWYGGYLATGKTSKVPMTLRYALVWVLMEHVTEQIGH